MSEYNLLKIKFYLYDVRMSLLYIYIGTGNAAMLAALHVFIYSGRPGEMHLLEEVVI